MKTIAIASALLSLLAIVGAPCAAQGGEAAGEIVPASVVSKVLVYSDRAVVTRTVSADLSAGVNRIVFDDLPERTEANSLQVKGSGKAVLQDTVFRTKYFAQFPDTKIRALLSAKQDMDDKVQLLGDKIGRAKDEKSVLEKVLAKVTAQIAGQAAELSPDKWTQMMNLYRDRLAALDQEIRGAEKDIRALDLELGKTNQELGDLQGGRQKKKNQALVILSLSEASKVSLSLSYIVYGPSWQPIYDLRVNSETRNLELSYNAGVIQNTGEDWANVSLALSTARPEIGGAQPDLSPWYLSAYDGRSTAKLAASGQAAPAAPAMNQMFAEDAPKPSLEPAPAPDIVAANAAVASGGVAVTFAVAGGASIASDNTSHRVSIMTKSFGAAFRYSSAPKLSPYAYLKAKVTNETAYPFLPGATKVFLDGSFIANSSIGFVAPGEEFWTYLGVDEGVKVDYKLIKQYRDDQGVFSQKTRYVYQYETKITNNKRIDAEIVVWDQLPISTDQKIAVKLIDPKYVKDTDSFKRNKQDFLEWLMTLRPQEAKTITFSFSVEYPSGMSVSGL